MVRALKIKKSSAFYWVAAFLFVNTYPFFTTPTMDLPGKAMQRRRRNVFSSTSALTNFLFSRAHTGIAMMNRDDNNCEPPDPANTVTDRLNTLLNSTGPGYTLQLCPGAQYLIQEPLFFSFPDQEISTFGYPTGDDRATLVVNGPVANGQGHTTAVDGTCANCSGVKLRHVQVGFRLHISLQV